MQHVVVYWTTAETHLLHIAGLSVGLTNRQYLMLWIGGQTHTYVTFVND